MIMKNLLDNGLSNKEMIRPGTSIKVPDLGMSVKSPGFTWDFHKTLLRSGGE